MRKILLVLLSFAILWPLDIAAMNQSAVPTKFNIPWGNGAGVPYIRNIPQASQIGIQNCAASLTDGFPPLTFTPSNAGGCPPFGADFNGIFRQITQWEQWNAAGGPILYDASFQSAIGGYPKSAQLTNASTPGCYWISTIDANGSNPDTGGANWIKSCQSPWTISGNNIFNNNTAFVGVNTTSPVTLLDVEGTSAAFDVGGHTPRIMQIADGNAGGGAVTSTIASVAISRIEALPSGTDTEGGQNAALLVGSQGTNTSTGGNISQVNAISGVGHQFGTGDVVGVGGGAVLQNTSGKWHAYGGFFSGQSGPTNELSSAVGVQLVAGNFSGSDHTVANYIGGSQVADFGLQAISGGNNRTTAAVAIQNTSTSWDVGLYFVNTPVSFQILGTGFNVDTGGNFNHTSDRTMKSAIMSIADGAIDKIMMLVPSTFTLNEDPKHRVYAGLIAQDIQPVMPEAISTDAKGHLVENDSSVIAYLVKAVQELKQQNDTLATEVNVLKARAAAQTEKR